MEKKELSTRQWATIKRTAQNVFPLIEKRNKLQKYVEELETINAQIEGMEYGTKALTGGYTSEEIVKRVVSDYVDPTTGAVKTDKDGRALKITKYVPNTDVVEFDAQANIYYISPKPVETTEEVNQ
jgi:hypothetical protein